MNAVENFFHKDNSSRILEWKHAHYHIKPGTCRKCQSTFAMAVAQRGVTANQRTSRTMMMINNIKPAEPPPIQMRLPNMGDNINDIKFRWVKEAGRLILPASG
jgi:hypothetical protein